MSIFNTVSAQSVFAFDINDMTDIADGDIISFVPGFAGRVLKTFWVQDTAVTTGSKLSTLNLEIGTTNLTGGTVALTSALCTPKFAVIEGAAVTGANVFDADDVITVEAASTTAFAEGAGKLYIVCGR